MTCSTLSRFSSQLLRQQCRSRSFKQHIPCCLRFSTSSENSGIGFSISKLGLERNFVTPVLDSIRQLPEIDTIYNSKEFATHISIDNLGRAADVFASFGKGGREHLATCALLAECQHHLEQYDESLETITEMQRLLQDGLIPNAAEDLTLAKAKALWTRGDFNQSEALCDSIITTYNDMEETFPTTNLHMASAMSGKALSQLLAMKTLDDAYAVRDYFRVTLKFLERHPPASNNLPQAAAYSNCGTAEAIYALFLEEANDVSVPMDAALKCWFQGLQQIKDPTSAHLELASCTLQANMQANLAWGVLNYETDRSDSLKKASDYAKKALEAHDAHAGTNVEGLRRVLSIVAKCYHEAGSSVTAEGLFQSATDTKQVLPGPLTQLEIQDSFLGYADLCSQWERRESDAKRLEEAAANINHQLPDAWKGKRGIHSTLWFWTPGDFL